MTVSLQKQNNKFKTNT